MSWWWYWYPYGTFCALADGLLPPELITIKVKCMHACMNERPFLLTLYGTL
jgi:hypothetical protein